MHLQVTCLISFASTFDWTSAAREALLPLSRRITEPNPIPHPDDIIINMNTGLVDIHGPMTKEEKPEGDWRREFMAKHGEFVAELEEMVAKKPKNKPLRKTLVRHRRIQARITKVIPD